jgi:hypothetical protein
VERLPTLALNSHIYQTVALMKPTLSSTKMPSNSRIGMDTSKKQQDVTASNLFTIIIKNTNKLWILQLEFSTTPTIIYLKIKIIHKERNLPNKRYKPKRRMKRGTKS